MASRFTRTRKVRRFSSLKSRRQGPSKASLAASSTASRMLWLASLSVAASPLFLGTPVWAQNTPVDVPNGTTELDGLSAGATNPDYSRGL